MGNVLVDCRRVCQYLCLALELHLLFRDTRNGVGGDPAPVDSERHSVGPNSPVVSVYDVVLVLVVVVALQLVFGLSSRRKVCTESQLGADGIEWLAVRPEIIADAHRHRATEVAADLMFSRNVSGKVEAQLVRLGGRNTCWSPPR